MQQICSAGWGIQPHPIGQAAVSGWVVGKHQGDTALGGRSTTQVAPAGHQLAHPIQPFPVWAALVQGRGQAGIGAAHLLEGSHPGGDATIQFGQGHLQAEVEGPEANGAFRPGLAALAAAQELEHRHRQALPQGRPQACLLKLHRGKGGGADHGVHGFTLQQVGHAPLHGLLPQTTHPKGPGRQPLLPEAGEQVPDER